MKYVETAMAALASRLASEAGLGEVNAGEQFTGGANNRVFRLECIGGPALLKVYFRSERDPRDRFGAEYSFLEFARQSGIDCVARVLAADRAQGALLQNWLPGKRPHPDQIHFAAIQQAADFLVALNQRRETSAAQQLPIASEACFRITDHVRMVNGRVARLAQLSGQTPLEQAATEFVASELMSKWQTVKEHVPPSDEEEPLPFTDRCLSPSDFGFHNALMDDSGGCKFVDFEYAGWDDPAKTVIDFFSQPTLPVGHEHVDYFLERMGGFVADTAALRRRMELLWPVYLVKWCCIVLNIFHPVAAGPRRFAGSEGDELRSQHLDRARAILGKVDFCAGFAGRAANLK